MELLLVSIASPRYFRSIERAKENSLRTSLNVMRDAIDAAAARACLRRLGIDPDGDATAIAARVVNIFAKAEAAPGGDVRGERHTMLGDSDINSTRHARAAVGAVLASVIGQTSIYVSGGAEHQGPPGGGPFAIVAHAIN